MFTPRTDRISFGAPRNQLSEGNGVQPGRAWDNIGLSTVISSHETYIRASTHFSALFLGAEIGRYKYSERQNKRFVVPSIGIELAI